MVKLQRTKAAQLTSQENPAVKMLLKTEMRSAAEDDESNGDASMEQTLEKCIKVDENGCYVPVDFIHGSSTEVEPLWSFAKYVLTEQRGNMIPILFEEIMFLKYKSSSWNEDVVAAAVRAKVWQKSKQPLDEIETQIEFDFGEIHLEKDFSFSPFKMIIPFLLKRWKHLLRCLYYLKMPKSIYVL